MALLYHVPQFSAACRETLLDALDAALLWRIVLIHSSLPDGDYQPQRLYSGTLTLPFRSTMQEMEVGVPVRQRSDMRDESDQVPLRITAVTLFSPEGVNQLIKVKFICKFSIQWTLSSFISWLFSEPRNLNVHVHGWLDIKKRSNDKLPWPLFAPRFAALSTSGLIPHQGRRTLKADLAVILNKVCVGFDII